jgi:hypothetical protein
VKIISILKISSLVVNIILLFAVCFIGYKLFVIDNYLPMNCMSSFYINKDGGTDITGNVKIVFHITEKGHVVVNEYGTLENEGQEYIVDRSGDMTISKTTVNGFHRVIKGSFTTNKQDTTPPDLTEKLTSSQSVFFYKIQRIDEDTWRISDLKRTIFMCRK